MRRHPQVLSATTPIPRSASAARRRGVGSLALAAVLMGALAACKTVDETPPPPAPVVVARLGPTGGSTMSGSVSFWAVDGGVRIGVTVANVKTGPWRVVIHANGNCTSPNGFSAGPPLEVPGVPSPIAVVVSTGDYAPGEGTFRLPGLALEGPNGVMGRSVVVHAGLIGSLEAVPGVPNNRYACGVIERSRPLF